MYTQRMEHIDILEFYGDCIQGSVSPIKPTIHPAMKTIVPPQYSEYFNQTSLTVKPNYTQ